MSLSRDVTGVRKKRRVRKQKQEIVAYAYDKRGRLISIGRNSYTKSHPIQHHYATRVGRPDAIYLHAEIAALLGAGKRVVESLEVVRYNKQGQPVLAKPCDICEAAIRAWGVKYVVHT